MQTKGIKELSTYLVACGLECSGNKPELVVRLAAHLCDFLEVEIGAMSARKIQTLRMNPLPLLVSIDVGLRNLAYSCLDMRSGEILMWKRTPLDFSVPHYLPKDYASAVQRLVNSCLNVWTQDGEHIPIVLIEQQRHRTFCNATMAESVFLVSIVEAQLHAMLLERNVPTLSIPPQRVAKHFGFPIGNKEKKNACIRLINGWISNGVIHQEENDAMLLPFSTDKLILTCPHNLKTMFYDEKKKDDLSDSLAQAIAYYQWQENSKCIAKLLVT